MMLEWAKAYFRWVLEKGIHEHLDGELEGNQSTLVHNSFHHFALAGPLNRS